jgi:7,8-dihydropterin-6-yl-methyl-4-(beta-D-ribofuranosyl)aminobenzene 5'-phosphate synthase
MNSLTILVDNACSSQLHSEHGLAMVLEYNNHKYIFDTGASSLYTKNAQLLNIDLQSFDTVVLSHGHWDHANGLNDLPNKSNLIAHEGIFTKRYRKDKSFIGINSDEKTVKRTFNCSLYSESVEIAPNIFFLTNIPKSETNTDFLLEDNSFDQLEDDSSIAIKTPEGVILLSGCAHAGIQNHIIEACRMTGERSIKHIVGGLHIKTKEQADEIGKFLSMHVDGIVYTGHCTSREAMLALSHYIPVQGIYSGFKLLI